MQLLLFTLMVIVLMIIGSLIHELVYFCIMAKHTEAWQNMVHSYNKLRYRERTIGEVFKHKGKYYMVMEFDSTNFSCTWCDARYYCLHARFDSIHPNFNCYPTKRKDGKSVFFKKIEKP
ncbi:MAG: hypothetical protein LBT43_04335 [Prevotella sp.]|nr:hypothetical protein [Prevotella sp.]